MSEDFKFFSPNQELEYLRAKVLEAEKKLKVNNLEGIQQDVIKESINQFKQETGDFLTTQNQEVQALVKQEAYRIIAQDKESQLKEMMLIAEKKGISYALKIVATIKDWHKEDDFHAFLVEQAISNKFQKTENNPLYRALNMRLFEIVLPKESIENKEPITELIKSMEQFYAGILSVAGSKKEKLNYLVFEIANPSNEEDTRIFVSLPASKQELFSKQLLAIFPKAKLIARERDYNIFNEKGFAIGASASLSDDPAYPLKTFENFNADPLNVILNGFSKIPKNGTGAALQIVFKPSGYTYNKKYEKAIKKIEKGVSAKEALKENNLALEIIKTFSEVFIGNKKTDDANKPPIIDTTTIEAIKKKISSPIVETNIRLAVSAPTEIEAENLMHNFQSSFNQFDFPGKQSIKWKKVKPSGFLILKDTSFYQSFIFRLFKSKETILLNLLELSTILHFNTEALSPSTTLTRSKSRSITPPFGLPESGTKLGVNLSQEVEKTIYITPEDRLRHFYVIGQTGTGKSTLLRNMVIDDIKKGEGVCFIDPHGSDVLEIISNIPKERIDDVIYFDPSDTERPMALNMLEYNINFPEQKTFVVNELFSIFQKLYGKVPESMGPMFEQYFRNATMLVIEDPETGCTLFDVSRVMSNQAYRDLKISRCNNPMIHQFWTDVAEKAKGEASLANIVPYITSKFDVFLANDIMRPIVSQEKSSLNFREIMDNRKIFLVNLAKGKLGDVNANLIGLIVVGKILMAALSRVDSFGKDLPIFYLYIDEFQNVTTNSVATILSEARKYRLSLTMAHQFINQLQDDIKNAVFGNVGNICSFRVGEDDAEYLEKKFTPNFVAQDLSNIDNFNAYLKMLMYGKPTEAFDIRINPSERGDMSNIEVVKKLSALKYGGNKAEIEANILRKYHGL